MNKPAPIFRGPRRLLALAVAAGLLPTATAAAQELPLVSRQLQFHAAPTGTPAGQAAAQPARGPVTVPVILDNVPNRPLPPGATILAPIIGPATGLYLPGVGGERGIVLPDTPAQLPTEAVPPLVQGQVYIPPWWDEVRNVRGGFGPADPGPIDRGVQPDDLRITPPAPGGPDLPETPPQAPVQGGALAPPDTATAPAASVPAVAPPAPEAPAEEVAGAPDSPIPLVSRRLNFQY